MKYLLYLTTLLAIIFTACNDNSTDAESLTCLNGGTNVGGECECTQGYTGNTCNQQKTPDVITVSEIIVTKFPSTRDDGGGWDPSSGPDIFPVISRNSQTVWQTSKYYDNASSQNTYSFSPNIQFTEPNQQYQVDLYDYDNTGSDLMGGVISVPYSSDNGFPSTIVYDAGGSVAFELEVSYSW